MSVKFKIAAILLAAFLVNVTCLLLYYQFFTLAQIKSHTQAMLESFEGISGRIADTVREYGSEGSEAVMLHLKSVLVEEPFNFVVLDESGQVLLTMKNNGGKGMLISNKVIYQNQDGRTYEVRISQNFSIPALRVESSVNNLIIFGSILLFLTLITVLLYMNYAVSKPLVALRSMMDGLYKPGNQPAKRFMGDEIKLLNQGFSKMSEELKKSKNSQDELISSISHDIKNPLTSILGYTERLLGSKSMNEERKERYHKIIHNRAIDIKNMIDEFSAYMEGESGNFNFEAVHFKQFIQEITEEYTDELSGMNRSFATHCNVPESCIINMDKIKIKRVVSNIISNSVKYAGENAAIRFSCFIESGSAVFVIEDSGKGVEGDELSRIFDLMYRCGAERNQGKDKTGSGLGLTICKRVVEHHGGAIVAFRSDMGGLGIRFSLPM